jgi:hypothetical protein
MGTARAAWMSNAEAALRALRDIETAVIKASGDDIREVHIVTSSQRPAKQIVRDVQTLLLARFQREIDHRVVSVAFTAPDDHREVAPPRDERAPERDGGSPTASAHTVVPERNEPEADGLAPQPAAAVDDRIRYGAANLHVSGPRIQAEVELRWKGLPRVGNATGHGTRDSGHRLVAQATLAAIQEFLEDDIALALEALDFTRLGLKDIVIVGVQLIVHREHKSLVGCCTVDQDVPQAVVLATLAAVNRVMGGLPTREPTEYVLRPTSM